MTRASVLALGIGSGVGVLALVVVVTVLLRGCGQATPVATSRPDPPAPPGAVSDPIHAKASGALRRLGCDDAVIVDMARVLGGTSAIEPGEPRFMVTCDVSSGSVPACDRLAGAYYEVIGTAEGNVCVRVSRAGAARPECSHLYAPNGADLGPFPRAP